MKDLINWIKAQPDESFLLASVLESLRKLKISFLEFEIHLNTLDENLALRAKIVGKRIPREDYQCYFPIGGGRLYPGSHVVAGHASPDVDTSIASFWSFIDAFAARVSEGPHLWYLPGGELPLQVKRLLISLFGEAVCDLLVQELPKEGTASLRDFCNREEANLHEGLEIISVVDHHRAHLQTERQCTVLLADVQSCNVLLAEQALALDRRYPVHPERARAERLCFLHAILDDTDLLSKVTARDIFCVADLLENSPSFDDLSRDSSFSEQAVGRLLENVELSRLIQEICKEREQEGKCNLVRCLEGQPSNVFVDTKVQNQSARVGQTKIFSNQFPWFLEHVNAFRKAWLNRSTHFYERKPHLNLHLQMISTLSGLNRNGEYHHADELWIWVPSTQAGLDRLSAYLESFKQSPEMRHHQVGIQLLEPNSEIENIFNKHFEKHLIQVKSAPEIEAPMAVIRFQPGKLNSRKGCITPYL